MTLKKLEIEYKKVIAKHITKHYDALRKYVGKEAIIPQGKFKGRLGVIKGLFFDDDGNILAMIRPYRLAGGPREDLLWDHLDARTYWPISDKDLK